ncbi:MAG TPA: FHA domain-containing protein [Blastocatellia bacterium]|nr:FHA domain-containing protein [Blastocatellia bacterium]
MDPSAKQEDRKDFIRITREEATSVHVDDLLKRQMSLRGETGVTRDRRRSWYYQNWFVFMAAGLLAALGGWGMLEPYFDDLPYIQGPIERLNTSETLPTRLTIGNQSLELNVTPQGYIEIRDQKVWLLRETRLLQPGGSKGRVDASALQVGQQVGVYAEFAVAGDDHFAFAMYLDPSPAQPAPDKALLTLRQLSARTEAAGLLLFALVGGLIGLAIGSIDGIICRLPRRALIAGGVGLVVGFIGGFVSGILANLAYAPLTTLAMKQTGESIGSLSTFGFLLQMGGRALAWSLAGITMGLGQGIALRSKRLLIYGLLGGVIGGLIGGLMFDPIHFILVGTDAPSAHWSRLVGLAAVGSSVGAMIGVVELLVRDAWLRMTAGPLAGKEFLIFKDVMNIGSSPRSDIFLFNDPQVADLHATLRSVGDECEIESRDQLRPLLLNGRPLKQSRLRHGDEITIGRAVFVFQKRQG